MTFHPYTFARANVYRPFLIFRHRGAMGPKMGGAAVSKGKSHQFMPKNQQKSQIKAGFGYYRRFQI